MITCIVNIPKLSQTMIFSGPPSPANVRHRRRWRTPGTCAGAWKTGETAWNGGMAESTDDISRQSSLTLCISMIIYDYLWYSMINIWLSMYRSVNLLMIPVPSSATDCMHMVWTEMIPEQNEGVSEWRDATTALWNCKIEFAQELRVALFAWNPCDQKPWSSALSRCSIRLSSEPDGNILQWFLVWMCCQGHVANSCSCRDSD